MVELRAARRTACRTAVAALALSMVAAMTTAGPAQARHHGPHRVRVAVTHRGPAAIVAVRARGGSYTPPFSEYAIDGNSGRVLYARDENALRHPASITKVMTLYMLFEQLEKGRMSLDTRIPVSVHAAAQAPTKLGLRPGSTIRVEDAVKSIVTKSANDMAVAVAESIGGDEPSFARMMTRKAHALGMSHSNFVNASGLPDDMQLTTARDLATLGRAIHDRFPRYFRFFSTPSFRYAGQFMPNHNHLMEQVEGMDGIKTGYTRSSGFNLLSSVNRNGHWLISVVLGGKTRLGRDRIMADLIASQIDHCATVRTAPMVAENPALEQVAEAIPVVQHVGDDAPPVQEADDETAEGRPAPARAGAMSVAAATDHEAGVSTEATDATSPAAGRAEAEPEQTAAVPAEAPEPVTAHVQLAAVETPRPRPAFVPGVRPADADMTVTGSIRPRAARFDGTTGRSGASGTATPASFRLPPRRDRAQAKDKPAAMRVASLGATAVPAARPSGGDHGGWIVQIGATPTLDKANELIARAKPHVGAGRPFTESVRKGGSTLFRARFAGLDAAAADQACRSLKRAGFSCFASRN